MEIENVNGKANAGLTTGIIGTALAGLLSLGGMAGLASSASGSSSSNYVTKDELKMVQDLAAKDSQISLLQAENTTETKMIEVYKQAHAEVAALRDVVTANKDAQTAWNASQSVANAQMAAAIATNTNSIAALQNTVGGITKTVVPNTSVCPGWGNVTITPAATTTSAS